MPAIRVRTRPGSAPTPIRKPDGTFYRFELTEPGDRWRAYADEPADLVAELAPWYAAGSAAGRAAARQSIAQRLRAVLQAQLLAFSDAREHTPEQMHALRGTADPAAITVWTTETPLVLIEGAYAPAGLLPRPVAEPPAEILWIDPASDESLLRSLHYLGALVLEELAERTADRS
ncbi:hypothetical protein [Micromonospora sp. AKA38]|uniref:hypothetical protein n=1 Tax=Micromonospora sp. AKA38 TaxID=2733861 RepID=UPI0022CD1EC4|nr:hypothetical protein [Micromonospora sp. AKA38]GHJ15393.1 hypothetical protein TPA0908_33880 [Micromonospora sp. AKA38]